MSTLERFVRYCKVDTASDPNSGLHPSSAKQFDLANMLVQELKDLGVTDAVVDEHCYVYGHLESNLDYETKTVGFVAHMDTSSDYSGTNVSPRIIENYDGKDIELQPGVVTAVKDYPYLTKLVGKTLVVTDGNTLLGGDDKAGIAAIMETVAYYQAHPEVKHGRIAISFTPDEEIGEGAMFFNYELMGANFAYTLDGGSVADFCDETFNAASVDVTFEGLSIHPGTAKNRMINAARVACTFQNLLPEEKTPEHTEEREGFIHLHNMEGDVTTTKLHYIIRDHSREELEKMKELMRAAVAYINALYGKTVATIDIKDTYSNMKEVLKNYPEVGQYALDAITEIGYTPAIVPARGGTDGAKFSFEGLPCPNIGNGDGNCHGRYEYVCVEEMDQACEIIKKVVSKVAEGK